ncbi:MAG: hypothetical protein HND44_19530 [Chloroflexi bacterium]|nr:hypothetical protein [Ardenticatenaceae bacterium]MBL1130643.1 hypothetical protein [Chloroflexota bacterium]NOG36737.1 hypothetical protein [Chloroflexota bacterium]
MRKGISLTFFFGLLIGGMAALIIWYYQKSTSAEEGALALLDRLADVDRRWRQTREQPTSTATPAPLRIPIQTPATDETPAFLRRPVITDTAVPDDLTRVNGIGAVFAARLQAQGIDTIAKVKALSATQLAEVLQTTPARAENILAAAQAV